MSPPRSIAIAVIALGLALLAASHYRYGLAAQSGIVLGVVPLLFAGLLLGRAGVWITAVAYLAILVLGCWVDLHNGTPGVASMQDAFANLLQPMMGCAIVALILDRLILKSDVSQRRNRDLALLCRQLEVEIRDKERSQAQLVHSQRMDALGKLAGNVAHDFNNLLGVILGYAAQNDEVADERAHARFDRIVAATQRGKQLTDRLLTLARSDAPMRETFDANFALRDVEPMIASMFGARIALDSALCAGPAWVHMDYAEFEACLLNLAKNASDAMPDGGRFRIESAIEGSEVRIALEDDGRGMPPEVAARVFDPFFTTKPRTQGTGIGLAVVYRVVTEAGGRVDVRSAPGRGACFTLRLPLREAPHG